MKKLGIFSLLMLLAVAFTQTSALAHGRGGGGFRGGGFRGGGHRHFGGFYGGFRGPGIGFYAGPAFGFGYGYGWRQPYYQPYYYAPPPVIAVEPAPPPVYIERSPPLANNYWYYCRNPEGYYPYVKQCFSNWEQVAPQPPVR